MQGSINFDGTLSGSIAGGGGGGSEVTITPTLTSGTKIADFTIDEESGSLYAPTPPQGGVSDVQVNNSQVPDYESIVENGIAKLNLFPYLEKSAADTMFDLVNDEIIRVDDKVGDLEQIVPYKQDKLIAGNNITIDQDNVISASGGINWNYSTSEVYTGQNWIDGSPIYCKVFDLTIPNQSGSVTFNVPTANLSEVIDIRYSVNGKGPVYETPWYGDASIYFDSMDANGLYFYFQTTYNNGRPLRVIAYYTKV